MLPEGRRLLGVLTFLGTPAVALTIAVLLALWLLGIRRGMTRRASSTELTGASLRPVGMILLVVGAGAFFGAVLSRHRRRQGAGRLAWPTLGLPVIAARPT